MAALHPIHTRLFFVTNFLCALLLFLPGSSAAALQMSAAQPSQAAGQSLPVAPAATVPGSHPEILSVPAAAFLPTDPRYNYENHGRYLIHLGVGKVRYQAGVHLPNGALVTKVEFCFFDDSTTENPSGSLYRDALNQAAVEMAAVAPITN